MRSACQKQRVEGGVVEAFAEVAAGRQDETLLGVGAFQPFLGGAPLGRVHAAVEDHEIARKFFQPRAEVFEMIAAFSQDHRSASGFQAEQHVVENKIVAPLVLRQRRIERRHQRWPLRLLLGPVLKSGLAQTDLVGERPGRRLPISRLPGNEPAHIA